MPKGILRLISSLTDHTYDSNGHSQESVTVALLIKSYASRSRRKRVPDFFSQFLDKLVARRHSKNRETPIILHSSLKIYITDRSRNPLGHFYHLGMCASYDRVLGITKNIYENLHLPYFGHNCWFPNILKKGFFTVLLKDNLDVNGRSNFVSSHYHVTSISIIQFVAEDNTGLDFPEVDISQDLSLKSKRLSPLPQEYINVKKVSYGHFFAQLT